MRDDAGERIPVTVSIGLATWHSGERIERFVDRADRAMCASKTAGRSRVSVCAQEDALSRAALNSTVQASVPPS